jgi:uncharacterized protein YdeI (YjbR/CyaY-like superfamily)
MSDPADRSQIRDELPILRVASLPEDLRRALEANTRAGAFFEALDGANRYAIRYRIEDAKRARTRAARIARCAAMLAPGKTIHP